MRFSLTNRKLMKMLFDLGEVNQISGVCKVGRYNQTWTVYFHPVTLCRAEAFFSATVTGIYNEEASGDTLDECLDKLEAIIEEAAA